MAEGPYHRAPIGPDGGPAVAPEVDGANPFSHLPPPPAAPALPPAPPRLGEGATSWYGPAARASRALSLGVVAGAVVIVALSLIGDVKIPGFGGLLAVAFLILMFGQLRTILVGIEGRRARGEVASANAHYEIFGGLTFRQKAAGIVVCVGAAITVVVAGTSTPPTSPGRCEATYSDNTGTRCVDADDLRASEVADQVAFAAGFLIFSVVHAAAAHSTLRRIDADHRP